MANSIHAPAERSAAWLAPYVAALTVATVLGLAASLWPSAIAVAALAGVAWLAVALWRFVRAALKGDARGARRALALTILLLVTPGIFQAATWAGWVGRLWLYQPGYDAAVAESPPDPAGKLILFHWGHYLIWDEVSLAFDETDELARPQERQPPEFRARLTAAIDKEMQRRKNAPEFADPRWEATGLWRHYYVVQTHGEPGGALTPAPRTRPPAAPSASSQPPRRPSRAG